MYRWSKKTFQPKAHCLPHVLISLLTFSWSLRSSWTWNIKKGKIKFFLMDIWLWLSANSAYLNQASLTIRTQGRAGKFPVGGETNRFRQLLTWQWWLNSPWAPGHICGISVKLVVVVVLLFLVLVQGLTKVSDQSRALEDRNDSNNSLEVCTPISFIHLFYNSPDMDVVDMHNILIIPSDSVLWEKTMEASYLVGSFSCQFD